MPGFMGDIEFIHIDKRIGVLVFKFMPVLQIDGFWIFRKERDVFVFDVLDQPVDARVGGVHGGALIRAGQERAAQVLRAELGVAGALQFEVLADRIRTEYNIPVRFESTPHQTARWVTAEDDKELKRFLDKNEMSVAEDHHGLPVYLARTAWQLKCTQDDWPQVKFLKTREQVM